jgi:hypothetical protein
VPLKSNLGLLAWANLSWTVWLDAKYDSTQFQKKIARFRVQIAKLWPFYRTTFELGFRRCGTDSDEKSGEAMMMQTSWRMCGKVVARKERLKTSFATYLGLAMWRINKRQLAGQTDECIGSACCWIGRIG